MCTGWDTLMSQTLRTWTVLTVHLSPVPTTAEPCQANVMWGSSNLYYLMAGGVMGHFPGSIASGPWRCQQIVRAWGKPSQNTQWHEIVPFKATHPLFIHTLKTLYWAKETKKTASYWELPVPIEFMKSIMYSCMHTFIAWSSCPPAFDQIWESYREWTSSPVGNKSQFVKMIIPGYMWHP